MFVSRCAVQFSLGTFFKHLPVSNPATLCPYRFRPKTLTAATILSSSSYFETLDSRQKEQVHLYVDTLLQWNQKMNFTAVKEAVEVMERHIEDSLAIIPSIRNSYLSHRSPSSENLRLVDVGSGAGLPGLILAIACPGREVTLMESMYKICIFLEHVVGHIGLLNVQVVRGRAENLVQALCFREKLDVAVARAVAEMRVLAEYCLPLVCVGGLFVAAKAHDPQEEVRNAEKAIQILGASVFENLTNLSLESHSPYGQRTVIVCLKTFPAPRKYPRDPGTPEKIPL